MSDPPLPLVPGVFLAMLAQLSLRLTARSPSGEALGVLTDNSGVDRHVLVASGGVDGTWFASDVVPQGFPPYNHLMSQRTYNLLLAGVAQTDGSFVSGGQRYRLRVWFDGQNLTAEAV